MIRSYQKTNSVFNYTIQSQSSWMCEYEYKRERINSHLHFWHHHQTHTYTLALKREEGGEGEGGSDEWLFVVVAVVVPIYSFCRSQYDIICWQEFNYTYWKNREKWLECVNYIQYSSNNTHKKGRHSVIIFNIAVKN